MSSGIIPREWLFALSAALLPAKEENLVSTLANKFRGRVVKNGAGKIIHTERAAPRRSIVRWPAVMSKDKIPRKSSTCAGAQQGVAPRGWLEQDN